MLQYVQLRTDFRRAIMLSCCVREVSDCQAVSLAADSPAIATACLRDIVPLRSLGLGEARRVSSCVFSLDAHQGKG